jgi:hypothetical protein
VTVDLNCVKKSRSCKSVTSRHVLLSWVIAVGLMKLELTVDMIV